MKRALFVTILVVLFVGAGSLLVWYLAYGLSPTPPEEVAVAGLTAPVTVRWLPHGGAVIDAPDEMDRYRALGFVHGAARPWSVLLWRQTATGRLGEWFGEAVLPLDRLARQLGLAREAQAAFAGLPEAEQALLQAYAEGINAALSAKNTRRRDELVLLGLEADVWEPWHALALERLFAWLAAAPPPPDALAAADEETRAFFKTDRLLRDWLHLHGFENGIALAVADSAGTHLAQRHVYGASALPFFQEVAFGTDSLATVAASLPGTPFFAAGKTERRAWALLLAGTATLEKIAIDTTESRPIFERLLTDDGTEHLLAIRRDGQRLRFATTTRPDTTLLDTAFLDTTRLDTTSTTAPSPAGVPAQPAAPDSAWSIRWNGFGAATDFAAWRALANGEALSFVLLKGDGLVLDRDGNRQVLGNPAVQDAVRGGVVIGNTYFASFLSAALDSLLAGGEPIDPATVLDDDYSAWAAGIAPGFVDSVITLDVRGDLLQNALTYLDNWNYAYDRASIAASIFETWMVQYRDTTGYLPGLQPPTDTLYFENLRRLHTLQRAVAELRARFGTDQRQWRWEHRSPDRLFFPVWSADSLLGSRLDATARYAPLDLPGDGHPSALGWGPSPVQVGSAAPADWEAWISTNDWNAFTLRRRDVELDRFLGRYLISDRPLAPFVFNSVARPEHVTTLVPPEAGSGFGVPGIGLSE